MKDLIYSAAALIVGFILGALTIILGLVGLGAWVYVEGGKKKPAPKRDYTRFSGPKGDPGRYNKTQESRRKPLAWENVVLGTRKEAEDVLDLLAGFIERYGKVTVADFLSTVGVEQNLGDHQWGWTTVVAAQIRVHEDGFLLWLPTPELLK